MEKEILFSYREESLKIHHTLTTKPSVDNFAFQSHSHNMYEIYLFLSGDGAFVVEGNILPLERGVLIFTLCGQTHNLLLKSDKKSYERVALMFGEKYLPKECDELLKNASKGGCVAKFNEEEIQWLLQSIEILKNADSEYAKKSISASLIYLTVHKIMNSSQKVNTYDETEDDLVKQVIHYINRHFGKNISLDSIEKAIYRDKAYLGRRFKKVMGCSIWEYIIRKRIFSARQQLYLTQSVSDAFAVSGFCDYSAFYRKYKKYIGCSPSEDLKQFLK